MKECQSRIKAEPYAVLELVSVFVAVDDPSCHKAKKRKTAKEAAAQSGAASALQTHFLQQFRELSLPECTRELQTLFAILKGTVSDSILLMETLPLLETSLDVTVGMEGELLLARIVDLFHLGVIPSLPEDKNIVRAVHAFSRCLLPSSAAAVKKAALALMTHKWMKEIETTDGERILCSLLKCANLERAPEIARNAARIAAKWPLRRHHVENYLRLGASEESTQNDQQQMCLWVLDLLSEKEVLSGLL